MVRRGSTLGQGALAPLPDSLVAPPQIQKLADHSDVISASQNAPKSKISGEAYSAPQTSYLMGRGVVTPCQEPHTRPTHYRVGNPTNDRFQM